MAASWEQAQENERKFWESIYVHHIKDIDSYQEINIEKSIDFSNKITERHGLSKNTLRIRKVLDVGCGPYGIIKGLYHDGFDDTLFFGIDPLMDVYVKFNTFPVDKNIKLYSGVGESLPFKNSFFDYIFCTNVLDHVKNPNLAIQEIARVLDGNGLFCTSIHVIYPIWGPFRFLLKYIDKNHPHHFTEDQFYNLLSKNFKDISIVYRARIFEDQPEFRFRNILKSNSLIRGLKRYFSNFVLFSVYYNCRN